MSGDLDWITSSIPSHATQLYSSSICPLWCFQKFPPEEPMTSPVNLARNPKFWRGQPVFYDILKSDDFLSGF